MNYFLLIVGLLILVKGADMLIEGASKFAKILKVPAFIVGLFIVALGTSAPELTIGVISGLQGANILTLGNVIGSNIVNITVVMGITAMVVPLVIDSLVAKRELIISLFVQFVLVMMLITGNVLSRVEGFVLFFGMFLFLMYVIRKSKEILRKEKPDSEFEEEIFEYIKDQKVLSIFKYKGNKKDLPKALILFIVGLVALIFGANLAVENGVMIAEARGWSPEFIGITIIAFGTCLPELVTCLMAVYKKEDDIAVGNIIGSNIINILLVLGVSSMINPIVIDSSIFFDLAVMTMITVAFMVPTIIKEKISRKWGFLLFGLYIVYMAYKISWIG